MRVWFGSILIGIIAGIIDVIPMIIQKMNIKSIVSAFLQYVFLAVIILNIKLPLLPWWIQGAFIAFAFALPIVIIVSEEDKKAIVPILVMSIILGTLISLAGHYASHFIRRVI